MADDMAQELRASNVTVVSLWPGFVKTEHVRRMTISSKILNIRTVRALEAGESVYYPGKAVVALAKDPNRLRKTGRILITADLGAEYGFKDVDGGFYRSELEKIFQGGIPQTSEVYQSN